MLGRFALVAVFVLAAVSCSQSFAGDEAAVSRENAIQLRRDGNYREAADMFRMLALAPGAHARDAAENLRDALVCLTRLPGTRGEAVPEPELLVRDVIASHPDSWRVSAVAAEQFLGFDERMEFRPQSLGNETLRTWIVFLLLGAERHLDDAGDPATTGEKIGFYKQFEAALRSGRSGAHAWRLTALTDLSVMPEAEGMFPSWAFPTRGAPVDEKGEPIYYRVPASWDAAENDGGRWRWVLGRMEQLGGEGKAAADWLLGEFLTSQFGVQTMTEWQGARDADLAGEDGPFAVRTLRDDETIARLGGGLKRFVMPDEFNHILVLRRVAESGTDALRAQALAALGSIFENRQQYPKAVEAWRRARAADAGGSLAETAELAIGRITANSGMLEPGASAPAGRRTVLSYLFRNGEHVSFTAKRLDEKMLLDDIRERLKADGDDFFEQYNYRYRRPEALGQFVFEESGEKYIAETAAEWSLDLAPLPGHFSKRVDVEVPVDAAGCYLVEAAMRDGNVSRVVVWIADLALVRKDAFDEEMFFVADAASGEPVEGAVVSFLGIEWNWNAYQSRPTPRTSEFAEKTDADGLLFVPAKKMRDAEWLITAETEDGRLAYLGFDQVWALTPPSEDAGQTAAFLLTDRPAYRPGQEVRFKAWLGKAAYTPRPGDGFANHPARIVIINPRGDTVYDKTLTADAYGGVDGSFTPDENAVLGHYSILLTYTGDVVSFRVEEYKKPEFEVSLDAPEKALALGDSAQLKVKAAYYHGAPVTGAKATYKILRTPRTEAWIPLWRWDWLYGAGAWMRPARPERRKVVFRPAQPELVAEGEGVLDADGEFRFTLDTAPAKELFGHQDHEYQISFEVMDASRRSIAGSGTVVAAREPFAVTVWTERGYYRAGDEVEANVRAALPLGGGVAAARGRATLHRVAHDEPAAAKEAGSWDVATGADGTASFRFRAGEAGQYRLAVRLRGEDGKTVEGATILTVRGAAEEGDFRFSALELVPDKREYKPGETLRLAVNSENKNGVGLLLPRAERGGGRLKVVRLNNGTHFENIEIGRADQPNFFCEAITVFGGETHSEVREIFVPPADKALRVAVESDKDSYLPGERATFRIAVTDADGDPVAGQCAVSLYDKSVEYISGGSNVGDIRAAFWSWKRFYGTGLVSSLARFPYPVVREGDKPWQPIGIFGGEEADWNGDDLYANGSLAMQPRRRGAMAKGDGLLYFPVAESSAPAMGASMAVMADMAAAPGMAYEAAPAQPEAMPSGGPGPATVAEPAVRSEFADAAFWTASLETDDDGRASFAVDMPENLTGWKARAWVMGAETRVGEGAREVATRKNVIVRPQAPRFLTQKDQVVLSANLHNYLPRAKAARAELVLEGGILEAAEGVSLTRTVELAANGEARADWLVDAKRPGTATVVMKLLTDEESDAAEISIPVLVHGARRVENFGSILRPDEERRVIRFTVPAERLADQSRLEFSFSPGIAVSLLEALPFLIDYPYGCTEQTLNRFLPVTMTRKYLDALGVSLADAKAALERSAARDDAQSAAWREQWGDDRAKLGRLPVFDDAELAAMTALGLKRLAGMQNADGGWGWFSGAGESSWPHTTAVVVHGLKAAAAAGVALPSGMLERGAGWLGGHQAEQIALLEGKGGDKDKPRKEKADGFDAFINLILTGTAKADARMRDFLYRDRLDLPLTGLAMLGLALEREGRRDELEMVVRNLSQFVETNGGNGTAWLRTPARGWWLWHNDEIETQAWYLKLLARTDPRSGLASGVAKYLLANRKNGSYWRSTRDTAYAIEALTEYASASGESEPDMTVRLLLDGQPVIERRLARENLLEDNRFVLGGVAVEEGEHELVIERSGGGALYFGGSLSVFSLEDPIAAAGGADLSVSRKFYKLTPVEKKIDMQTAAGAAARGNAEKYGRTEIAGSVEAGDLIEAELTVSAANDYEYLVFEDMKAAGLEAVELRSGYGGGTGAYVEYRDEKVVLFMRALPRGEHRIAYRFRAEIPGAFSALPVFGGGMYATGLFCNSAEAKLRVTERGTFE